MESTRRCARAVFVLFTRGFRGRPTGKIARRLPGEFLAREPYYQVLERADISPWNGGASETGDHDGDVLAA